VASGNGNPCENHKKKKTEIGLTGREVTAVSGEKGDLIRVRPKG